jgi:hypothetical protein
MDVPRPRASTNGMGSVDCLLHDLLSFNRWDYVEENNVQLPDEYDQIHRDLEIFWSLRPAQLRQIQLEREGEPDTFTVGKIGRHRLGIVNMTLIDNMMQMHLKAAYEMIDVLKPVEQLLPPFRAIFSPHDNPSLVLSWELKQEALQAIKEGRCKSPYNSSYHSHNADF